MTDKSRRQLYVLGGLVAVLAIVVLVRMPSGDAVATNPAQAGSTARPSNQAGRAKARQDVPMLDVKLDALQPRGGKLAEADRNPFRFKPKAPPPPPRSVTPQAQQQPPQTFVPPAPVGPPPPPPIPLRYIGLLGAASAPDRVAVLSDARGNPIYGKEGDIIEGRYRVLRIAGDSVDLAYTDGRGRQTLRLSTQ